MVTLTGQAQLPESMVAKIWSLCNVLRGDGVSYHQYISELTYLLFLKIAKENGSEEMLSRGYRWNDLAGYKGENLLGYYQELLTHLGANAKNKIVRDIYAFPTTVFSHSENLRVVISGIDGLNWHSVSEDGIGRIYEGLLSRNSEDARSGAGQYFTPRALVDCIIAVTQPSLAETIQDPATGTGGFLIGAEQYIRSHSSPRDYSKTPPRYQGMEIERGTYRLCLMNIFLHRMKADLMLGDALTADASALAQADLILANPPFGSKSGGARDKRSDLSFPSSNKQLEFLQHIYQCLKNDGRAAVIVPDNVLFEGGVARQIRIELMDKCVLHTILRLPIGIFYAQNVSTNVLFFTKSTRESGATKRVWIYDLRSSMPRFGKRSPLTLAHFSDFIKCYGPSKDGTSRRRTSGIEGRFRSFERAEIAANGDDLNLKWLADKSGINSQDLLDPETIAGQIIENLRQATTEAQNLIDMLASLSDQGSEPNL